jgi:SAM-dependent methyltransferase
MRYYPPRYLFRRYELLRRVTGGDHFLEIGPGRLMLSVELLRHFRRGTLIDFSPGSLAFFAALGKADRDRLNLIVADFMEYSFEASFDAVIACEVLEHIRDESAFLGKIRGLLNPGGRLILSVPARKTLWSDHDEIAGHYRRYDRQEITDLLSRQDFKLIDIVAYGYPFINTLRMARIIQAKWQYAEKIGWSTERKTKESGSGHTGLLARSIGLLLNPVTVYPLCLISSLFNGRDRSEGYLVISEK